MQKQDTSSFAYHRKRTRDNLVWIIIIVALLVFACSCSTERRGCSMRRGFIGYDAR